MVIQVGSERYSIEYHTDDEGSVVAHAIGPLPRPGEGAAARGVVARATGKTEEEARENVKHALSIRK